MAQALTRIHPARSRFPPRLAPAYRKRATRPCVRSRPAAKAARRPEPLCLDPALPDPRAASRATSGGVGSLPRSYGLMRQTTPLPLPSVSPLAPGLRRLQSAPAAAWPFPTLFRIPFPTCLDPYSGCLWSALARFFPQSFGLPRDQRRVGPRNRPASDFSPVHHFGVAVIPLCSGPQVCSPPRSLPPRRTSRRVAVAFPPEHLAICCLLAPRVCSPSESGD